MVPKLLVLAAVSVLLVSCLDERSDTLAVHCTDPNRADCIAVAEGTLWGPGTFRLPGSGTFSLPSRYVFDVSAGRRARVLKLARPEDVIVEPMGAFGIHIPLPYRRLPEWDPLRRPVVLLAPAEAWSAAIVIDARTGEELRRYIVTTEDSTEEIVHYPTMRFVLDLRTFRTTDRFPLDRVSILPAVDVLFARTAADLLFDQIVASIRLSE